MSRLPVFSSKRKAVISSLDDGHETSTVDAPVQAKKRAKLEPVENRPITVAHKKDEPAVKAASNHIKPPKFNPSKKVPNSFNFGTTGGGATHSFNKGVIGNGTAPSSRPATARNPAIGKPAVWAPAQPTGRKPAPAAGIKKGPQPVQTAARKPAPAQSRTAPSRSAPAPAAKKVHKSLQDQLKDKSDAVGKLKDQVAQLQAEQEGAKSKEQELLDQISGQEQQYETELQQALARVQELEEQLQAAQHDNTQLQNSLTEQQQTHNKELRELKSQLQLQSTEILQLKTDKSQLEEQVEQLHVEHARDRSEWQEKDLQQRVEKKVLQEKIEMMMEKHRQMELEAELLNGKLRDMTKRNENLTQELHQAHDCIKTHEETISSLNDELMANEQTRRQLHNTIQELKGNIRVFCRVRPLLASEDGDLGPNQINFPDKDQRILELERLTDANPNETLGYGSKKGKHSFNFDKVFGPESSQKLVFDEISQLVQSSLDGYNVCIFAYGQTGSGKTYTMEGAMAPEAEGMIPRAVTQVFQTATALESKGWDYKMDASFLEIYNETLRDLLSTKNDGKLEIKLAGQDSKQVMVTNQHHVAVTNYQQVRHLLEQASKNRAVAETKCNERSSRSHSVFRLHISGSNDKTQEKCCSTLNLIDLAGSERLKQSGSKGDRLTETKNINKSLAELSNVITALARKDKHIPYRNSKLTYLLQDSLGGNSKTLMFVNVSPKEECFGETLNSLRFATMVNNCQIGTASKTVKV